MAEAGFANNNMAAGGYGPPPPPVMREVTMSQAEKDGYYRRDHVIINGNRKVFGGDGSKIEDNMPGQFVSIMHNLFSGKKQPQMSGKIVNRRSV